jgi:cytochrome P450/NADPH-cytochrome P450 reductase
VAESLFALSNEAYQVEIADKHVSVLDILERFQEIPISIEEYLSMVPLMRPRVYSIASDPGWVQGQCSLVATVIDQPHWSGRGHFLGVATNYLTDLLPGGQIRVSLKQTNPYMRLPSDGLSTPIIMIAAGSGIAPFRGFIQKRALQAREGQALGHAVLFFGCRKSDEDDLYRGELDTFEQENIVQVRRAFSREPHSSEANGARYIQDRLMLEKRLVFDLWTKGAHVYVCGGVQMAQAVRSTLTTILQQRGEDGDELLAAPRYVAEIFD